MRGVINLLTGKWNEGFVLRGEPPLENSDVGVAGERFGRILERDLRLRLQKLFVNVGVRLQLERVVVGTLKQNNKI